MKPNLGSFDWSLINSIFIFQFEHLDISTIAHLDDCAFQFSRWRDSFPEVHKNVQFQLQTHNLEFVKNHPQPFVRLSFGLAGLGD